MEGFDKLLENEEFTEIRNYPNYIISNMGKCYNKKTKQFVGADCKGYVIVSLCNDDGQQNFYIHQLVMDHFGPPKPDGIYEVDHINHKRDDNRIGNLRWATSSENQKNKLTYKGVKAEYISYEEVPDDLISLDYYRNHEFLDYYYSIEQNRFMFDTGINCRVLNVNLIGTGYAFVAARDINNKLVSVYFNKFKREHGIESF